MLIFPTILPLCLRLKQTLNVAKAQRLSNSSARLSTAEKKERKGVSEEEKRRREEEIEEESERQEQKERNRMSAQRSRFDLVV